MDWNEVLSKAATMAVELEQHAQAIEVLIKGLPKMSIRDIATTLLVDRDLKNEVSDYLLYIWEQLREIAVILSTSNAYDGLREPAVDPVLEQAIEIFDRLLREYDWVFPLDVILDFSSPYYESGFQL